MTSPNTRFAIKMFKHMASDHGRHNVFFSPASVMLCLWMMFDGATGSMRESIAKVLEIDGLEPEELQLDFVALKSALPGYRSGLQLESACSLWCNPECTPRPEYVARMREHYDADVVALDFRSAEAASEINAWVSAKTHDKISSILHTLDPRTFLLAVSAIYFKNLWSLPFERALTRDKLFHTSSAEALTVPFMSQVSEYFYYEEAKFQAIRLHYKSAQSMYVFLPAVTSNLEEFRQNLNSVTWDNWMGQFEMIGGSIQLPRFKLTYQADLRAVLEKLGMGMAFTPGVAQFDGIHSPPPEIWISHILHRALIDVNEEGTEAAAVTEAIWYFSSEKPSLRTFEMIVDRPFFFLICDDHTHNILFMGSVVAPQ